MKIAVDSGALNGPQFGNRIFTENLTKALLKYDKKNRYKFYTVKWPGKLFRFWGMFDDLVLVLNQQPPIITRGKIISFCHGLSYHFFPQYYSKEDFTRLKKQLEEMIKRSNYILVSSKKVKDELVSIYRYIDKSIIIIPFGIPFDMSNDSGMTSFWGAKRLQNRCFLYIGMNHPIKNIGFIKAAFKEFQKDKNYVDYELKIITNSISRTDLQKLYQGATALLTASHYESFNFPVLEALINNCSVIGLESAIIPEIKEFVNICDNNIDQFVLAMKKICNNKQKINREKLAKIFSWKEYIKKLTNLYVI